MVSALGRLNERGRWALSQARFMKGLGKREGEPALYLYSLYSTLPLGKAVAILCAAPVGLRIRKQPGSAVQSKSLDGGTRETHFAPPVGNPSVFGRALETRSCCVGPYARRRQQAAVLGTAGMRTVGK